MNLLLKHYLFATSVWCVCAESEKITHNNKSFRGIFGTEMSRRKVIVLAGRRQLSRGKMSEFCETDLTD